MFSKKFRMTENLYEVQVLMSTNVSEGILPNAPASPVFPVVEMFKRQQICYHKREGKRVVLFQLAVEKGRTQPVVNTICLCVKCAIICHHSFSQTYTHLRNSSRP